MNTSLTAKRLTVVFGALFLFQASMVAVGLSLSRPKFLPVSFSNRFFEGNEISPFVSDSPSADSPLTGSPLTEDDVALDFRSSGNYPKSVVAEGGAEADIPGSAMPQNQELASAPDGLSEKSGSGYQTVVVSSGDSLAGIFSRLGASHAAALEAHKALRSVPGSSAALRVGEEIQLSVDSHGEVAELVRELSDGRVVTLTGSSRGYQTSIQELSVIEESRTVSGVIQTSLSAAAGSLDLPFGVVDEFVDLFSNRVEFRKDLQPGDTFSVTFLTRKNGRTGEWLKPGAIASASLKTNGKLLVAVRHADDNGVARYFDEQGNPLGNYFLRYPVQFSRISSAFSYARFHPVLKRARPHNGVDFAAPVGTPVRAVADGVIDSSGYHGAAGNMIKISHGSRWSTAYLHLNSISSSIRPGARIERGQVIGTVGTTGLSTGPHLHFSLYDRGNYVDPLKTDLPSMQDGVRPLPREYLLAALEALDLEHQRVASLHTMASAG